MTDLPKRSHEVRYEVNEIMGSVEDAAGMLTTANTVLIAVIGEVEELRDLLKKDSANNPLADAAISRLDSMWALAETASQAVRDQTDLLYATVEKANGPDLESQAWNRVIFKTGGRGYAATLGMRPPGSRELFRKVDALEQQKTLKLDEVVADLRFLEQNNLLI
jgi:hypothetical protein